MNGPTTATTRDPPSGSRRCGGSTVGATLRRAAVISGLVGLLGACAPEEPPLLPVVWEGASVRVRMDDPGIQVCGGTFEAIDRHVELVKQALLVECDGFIDYTIDHPDFVASICSPAGNTPDGCAYPDAGWIYTSVPFVPHEIVHAVRMRDPELGYRSSPFEEGLATVFGADWLGTETVALDALGILREPDVRGLAEYHRAGQTMAILLEHHGVEQLRRFDVLARTTAEDRAFEAVFGETKEEFAAYADSVPHCEQSQWWAPLLECDGEPLTANPETGAVTLTGNVRCGEPDVRGPDFGRMWISRHFRLDESTGILGYRFDMPDDATLEIVSCNGGCPERFAYLGTRLQVGSIANGLPSLEPGEYFLRMSRPVSDEDGFFEIVLE